MTALDLVREYFPECPIDEVEHILGEKTGWPSFWNIPEDGGTPEECLRTQLFWYSWARKRGLDICYGCGKPMRNRISMCPKCEKLISERRKQ